MAHFRGEADVALHERIAREHLDDGMPIIELHRNCGLPLRAVRTWIEIYRAKGRSGLVAAAAVIAANNRKPRTRAQLARLTAQLQSNNSERVRAAVIEIGECRVVDLADAVYDVVDRRHGNEIEAVLTLGDLGAGALLDRAAKRLGTSYRNWIAGARARMP